MLVSFGLSSRVETLKLPSTPPLPETVSTRTARRWKPSRSIRRPTKFRLSLSQNCTRGIPFLGQRNARQFRGGKGGGKGGGKKRGENDACVKSFTTIFFWQSSGCSTVTISFFSVALSLSSVTPQPVASRLPRYLLEPQMRERSWTSASSFPHRACIDFFATRLCSLPRARMYVFPFAVLCLSSSRWITGCSHRTSIASGRTD